MADGGDSRVASPTGMSSWEPICHAGYPAGATANVPDHGRPTSVPYSRSVDAKGRRFWLVAALILLVGLGLRVPAILEPNSNFHPTRQYRDAIIARHLTYQLWGAPDPEAARLAKASVDEWSAIEPPIVEGVAAVLHVASPGEWWRIRLFCVAGWFAGALVLARAMRGLFGDVPALAGLTLSVLLPYSLMASTSFQPEPLLIGAMLAATGLLLAAGDTGLSRRGHVGFGLAAGLAGLLKLTALPVLLLPYLWIHRRSWRRRQVLVGAALAVVPAVAWLAAGLVFGDFLETQTESRIVPALLGRSSYWTGWFRMFDAVTPLWIVALAGFGVAVGPPRVRQVVVPSLLGYLAVGLSFTHLISTHDYYSLIAVPAVVVGAASFVGWLTSRPEAVRPRILAAMGAGVVAVLVILGVLLLRDSLPSSAERSAEVAEPFVGRTLDEGVVFSTDYATSLEYLTRSRLTAWPLGADLSLAAAAGKEIEAGPDLLDELRDEGTSVFVVTVPDAMPLVPEVVEMLEPYLLVACDPDGAVVDLEQPGDGRTVLDCADDPVPVG